MDSVSVLREMAEDRQLLHEVLLGLAHGTFDEWDCDLSLALETFGLLELGVASRSGATYVEHLKSTPEGRRFLHYDNPS